MLLVGYDVPIVQVMYLDNGLREHNLLQAIARVNRPYDERKDYGLIVDYCGITKELQKALAIFEEEDIKGALEPAEKELEELRLRHLDVISFFKDNNLKGILADGMYDSNNNFRYLTKNHIIPGINTRSNSNVKSTNCHARNMSIVRQQTRRLDFFIYSLFPSKLSEFRVRELA